MGAEVLDTGSVLLDGAELDESSPAVRSRIASLLDDAGYFPDVSAMEHLRLLAWLHSSPADVEGVAAEWGLPAAGCRRHCPRASATERPTKPFCWNGSRPPCADGSATTPAVDAVVEHPKVRDRDTR
ncbi:hypothetical protein [Lentzea sp. NPDC059081]|uniref:hypothetical protein n=1 Tax=Lentzea sp. NPDC059081 TaxID=3346719 RepID=UPI0036CC4A9B